MERQKSIDTEGILYLIQTHKLWNLSPEGEYDVFYDPLQRRMVFLQVVHVYAFEIFDKSKDSNPVYFRLPNKCKKADALAISNNDRYVAIQETNLDINFIEFDYQPTKEKNQPQTQAQGKPKETRVSMSSSKGKILSMCFLQSKDYDFLLCHCKGLEIYKYYPDKKQLKSMKSVSYNISNAWINPLAGLIVLSSSSTKGEMQIFHIKKDDPKLKNFKGSTFQLMLWQNEGVQLPKAEIKNRDTKAQKAYIEIPQKLTRNLKGIHEESMQIWQKRTQGFQIHSMLLTKLYSKNAFIHYNQIQGELQIYRFISDKVIKVPNSINLDTSVDYEIQTCDNLMIISDLNTSLVTIYDYKSDKLQFPLWHNGKIDMKYFDMYQCDNIEDAELAISNAERGIGESYIIGQTSVNFENLFNIPEESEIEEKTGELSNTLISMRLSYEDDSQPLKSQEKAKGEIEENNRKPVYNLKPREMIYVSSDLAYDMKNNLCFTYLFNKGLYLRLSQKKVKALINLMRRQKPKGIILNAVKQFMTKKISLQKLSKLFEKINRVFKDSQKKGLAIVEQCETHEARRVTAHFPLIERSSYQQEFKKAAIYVSKSVELASNIKVLIF